MGAMARQGPHHVAQKSTSTGLSDFKTSWSKFASVTSTIPLPACDGVDLVVLVSVPAISISPRCNVALFGGRSIESGRSRDPGRFYECVPRPGAKPIIAPLPFDAGGGSKVAKTSPGFGMEIGGFCGAFEWPIRSEGPVLATMGNKKAP